MQNTEYNTYQQYQGSRAMQKIFSLLRTDHVALLNIVSRDKCKEISSVRGRHDSQKKYFAKKVANMRTNEHPKLNRVDMKEIQMRKDDKVMDYITL